MPLLDSGTNLYYFTSFPFHFFFFFFLACHGRIHNEMKNGNGHFVVYIVHACRRREMLPWCLFFFLESCGYYTAREHRAEGPYTKMVLSKSSSFLIQRNHNNI